MDDLIIKDLIAEGYAGDELLRELEIRKKLVPIAVQNMVQDIIEQVKNDKRTSEQLDKEIFGEGFEMRFLGEQHKKNFWKISSEDKGFDQRDLERAALFYVIAGNDTLFSQRKNIYDFKDRAINVEIDENGNLFIPGEAWHTSSTIALIRLAYNLFNSFKDERTNPMDLLSSLDDDNFDLAINAITIRFRRDLA